MDNEIKIRKILSQLDDIKREVEAMLPVAEPRPAPTPVLRTAKALAPRPVSAPAPGVHEPTAIDRIMAKVADWFYVRGEFAPAGMSREFAVATRWLTRVGSVLLVGAIAYFLTLAINRGWIGPAQRVYGMMAWGAAGTAYGAWLRLRSEKYAILGEVCAAVGLVAVYLSFGLGHRYFSPPVIASGYAAFAGLFAATLAAGALSVRLRSLMIACLALAGGFLVPTICSFTNHSVQLHLYLLLLSAGATAVAMLSGWTAYGLVAAAVALAMGKRGVVGGEAVVSYLFVAAQFTQFMTLSVLAAKRADRSAQAPIWGAAALMSIASFVLSFNIVDNAVAECNWHCFLKPLHFSSWAAAFAALAVASRRRTWGGTPVLAVFASISAAFAILSACRQCWHLDGSTVLLLFFVYAAILAELGARSGERALQALSVVLSGLLSASGAYCFVYAIGSSSVNCCGCAAGLADRMQFMWPAPAFALFLGWRLGSPGRMLAGIRNGVFAAAGALAFVVMTGESHLFGQEFLPSLRGGFVTIVWATTASVLLAGGIVWRMRVSRRIGLALLAASVVKLLMVDTARLATPGRVGVFAAVGVLLITGAFLYLKFKSTFEESDGQEMAKPTAN